MGQAIAITVENGSAVFSIPTRGRSDKTLLVISSLTRGHGSRPIQVTSRAGGRPADSTTGRVVEDHPPEKRPVRTAEVRDMALSPRAAPPASRTFHVLHREGDPTRPENYLAVPSVLVGYGQTVQVYVDARDRQKVQEPTVRDLVETFERDVLPTAAQLWGTAEDVDGDGRFSILMTSWLDRLGGTSQAVDGLFRGADLVDSLGAPFSNGCDMLYLNPRLVAGGHLRTVLAHEYAHAVTFCRKCLGDLDGGMIRSEEESWLDEAIAHLVEDLHGFSRSNLDHRVRAFLNEPERYQLVVRDYYAANLFRSHGHRGSTYLFLRWCVDRYGPGLLGALITSDARGTANLEAATGSPFVELYRRWSVALYLDGIRPGRRAKVAGNEDLLLVGPRSHVLIPKGSTQRWNLAGTSSHYAMAEGSPTGSIRVEITAPDNAELQVTAVKLPEDLPRLELSARVVADLDGRLRIHAHVAELDGAEVRLAGMSWEPMDPSARTSNDPSHPGGLDQEGIATAFGGTTLGPFQNLSARPIELPGLDRKDGPIVLKLVGRDPSGRWVVAWATVSVDGS